jgi:hypothetical protein
MPTTSEAPPLALPGVSLPFLTARDPDEAREGSLDPMGLAPVADQLAEVIAPSVTARMSRIRFLTAIAVCAAVTDTLPDLLAADSTPPYIAFEWILVEALARRRDLPQAATLAVPGIGKARALLTLHAKRHMTAAAYLKGPRVFGFNGVYKRLARSLQIVTPELELLERGDELVRAWEREADLDGFSDQRAGTAGARLAHALTREVRTALVTGHAAASPRSPIWRQVANAFRLDGAKAKERAKLRMWMLDAAEPVRKELIERLEEERRRARGDLTEAEVLRRIEPVASSPLRVSIRAIDAYERLAVLLDAGFQALLYLSTGYGSAPVSIIEAARHPIFAEITNALPRALNTATERLEEVALAQRLQTSLHAFHEVRSPVALVSTILEHHESHQHAKERLPWVAQEKRGFRVRRFEYRRDREPRVGTGYVHPYRIFALSWFLEDLEPVP